MTRTHKLATLFAALLGTVGLSHLNAAAIKSDSEVKVSARATQTDAAGKQVVTVTMDINEGWYIYANPVKNEELADVQTVVNIQGVKPEQIAVRYPAGKETQSDGASKFNIYEGKVAIQTAVLRTAADAGPLEVSVRFMSCNKKSKVCLQPVTVKFMLP
jgi:DsbC/DsbD-like thiol-disulfide interchange protein